MLQPFPVALFTLVRAQLTFSVSFILLLFISTLFNPVKADGSNNSEYRSYGKTVNYNDRRYRNHKWKLLKAPKTVSPRGKTDVSEETYSWKPVSDAVEYTLVVRKRPTRKWRVRLLSQTITAAQAGCASGEALCSYNPGLALDNGRYKWKVRAISSRGRTSKWSNYRQFRVRDVVVTENNAPMANDVSASTNQGVSIDIMLEATDLDNDSLTYSVDATSDNGGTISLVGSLVTYSPSQDFVGTDTFTFTANDGTVDSNMATVSIAVNRVNTPPEAVDQSISVDENGSVDFTLNASDADGDPLTYTFINQPVSGVLSGEAPNLTYKPDEGFTGEDSFRYFAVDGFSDTANTTVTITVNAVNTPPLAEAGDAQEVFETQKVTLSGSGSDEDGTIASYFWEQTGGTLVSLDGVNSENLVFDADELTADETLTFTLTVTDNEGATATDNVTVLVKNLEIFDADLIICLGDNNNPQELLTLTGLACNNEVVDDDTDFSELEKLVSLTFLDLSGNKLSNLSTLSGLTSLTNLNLSNNQIVDVSALSELTAMRMLDLTNNLLIDFPDLTNLNNLQSLIVVGNCIEGEEDQNPVEHCTGTTTTLTGLLNDTGITTCGNYVDTGGDQTNNQLNCFDQNGDPATTDGVYPIPTVQDGQSGRDITDSDPTNGHAGFDFTKIDASGVALSASAPEWACVKDNVTGLLWEVKTTDGGLHDRDEQYSWYQEENNGGFAGFAGIGTTQAFADQVNNEGVAGLCGASTWRLPSREELRSIVSYDRLDPAIDTDYFPNTRNIYFTSTHLVTRNNNNSFVRTIAFFSGFSSFKSKFERHDVRLVTSGQ